MDDYLIETQSITYMNSDIQYQVQKYINQSSDEVDYINTLLYVC